MRPRRLFPRPTFLPVLVLAAACSDGGPVQPAAGPMLAILDGANGGNEGFYFLPPMVGEPGAFDAGFNGALSPVVKICDPAGCDSSGRTGSCSRSRCSSPWPTVRRPCRRACRKRTSR